MWGFLITSHAPINANENLVNKPYFCLGLFSNLVDLLIPVDTILIILDIFDTFSPSLDSIPTGASDDCWLKQTFYLSDYIFLYAWYRLRKCDRVSIIFLGNSRLVIFSFTGIFLNICITPRLPEVNIIWCKALWSELYNICPIWGHCTFPNEWNCGNSSSKTTWNWGKTWAVAGFRTIGTDTEWNSEYQR